MKSKSAGILVYKRDDMGRIFALLVHPGGPLWKGKDTHSWSIPKGEFDDSEDPFVAAKREFEEELGQKIEGNFLPLSPQKQPSGKVVYAWAVEGSINAGLFRSNEFQMEWPPKSGKMQNFPEVDKAEWFDLRVATTKVHKGQIPIIEELQKKLNYSPPSLGEEEAERMDGGLFG